MTLFRTIFLPAGLLGLSALQAVTLPQDEALQLTLQARLSALGRHSPASAAERESSLWKTEDPPADSFTGPMRRFHREGDPVDLWESELPPASLILGNPPPTSHRPMTLRWTHPLVPTVNEAAAGFPGEVIDEVIVPVPSEIFLVLDKLGKPDWRAQLRNEKPPVFAQRMDVALVLGSLVAEGFIAVQAQDQAAVERIGKDVLKLSESLGLKESVLPHTDNILEASRDNHWEIVRVEFDKTQKTVRDVMEQRRDRDMAQAVSLAGWLRGTEAVTEIILKDYTSDAAELLNQPDVISHFQKELRRMPETNPKIAAMRSGLNDISRVIGSGDEPPSADGVRQIRQTTSRLVKTIATPPGRSNRQ